MGFWDNIHPLLRRERTNEQSDSNYAILNAIDEILKEAEQETIDSKIQSNLKTATGDYLDHYGKTFGVYRNHEKEPDTEYRKRIIERVDISRGTNQSIKANLIKFIKEKNTNLSTEPKVDIYEPWQDILITDKQGSHLDSQSSLLGYYYDIAVIDISINVPVTSEIISLINEFKPSGVTLHVTYDPDL